MKRSVLFALCWSLCGVAGAAEPAEPAVLGDPACKVLLADAPESARVEWKGACKDGYADGEGVLAIFKGRAPDAQFDGQLARGMMAKGYLKYEQGNQYDGQFKNGKPDGLGILLCANGDRYDGPFKDGKRDGRGSQSYLLGGRYDGHWKNDDYDGLGSLTYAGGHQVTGTFARGALVGAQGRPAARAADAADGAATDAAPVERFVIYADRPTIGSTFRQVLSTSVGIPFDKGYDKMTPAQQARVRARYSALEDGDEPPYPLKGSAQHFHYLNRAGEWLNVPRGTLRAVAFVDAGGNANKVALLDAPDAQLGEIVTMMLLETKYKPAVCGGKPCAMAYPLVVETTRE